MDNVRWTVNDVIAFIEEKMKWNEETDKELGLYLDYKKYGKKAFKMHKSIYKKIIKQINKEYNGIF